MASPMPNPNRNDVPTAVQHRRMHALWRAAGVTERADRLALTSAVIGRSVTTSSELTGAEAAQIIRYMTRLDQAGWLRERAAAWLTAWRKEQQ